MSDKRKCACKAARASVIRKKICQPEKLKARSVLTIVADISVRLYAAIEREKEKALWKKGIRGRG